MTTHVTFLITMQSPCLLPVVTSAFVFKRNLKPTFYRNIYRNIGRIRICYTYMFASAR